MIRFQQTMFRFLNIKFRFQKLVCIEIITLIIAWTCMQFILMHAGDNLKHIVEMYGSSPLPIQPASMMYASMFCTMVSVKL
jgi:hypothetical protein